MLRLTVCFLIIAFIFAGDSIFNLPPASSIANLTRLTNTPEHAVNLNPTLSDDGRVVIFESSADLAGTRQNTSFHAVRANLEGGVESFFEFAGSRAVSPATSSDGEIIVFASTEDIAGQNADRNSEIFLFDGTQLQQLTRTEPASPATRLVDGNFQPSITADGRRIVFSSNRNFTGENIDLSQEILLYDTKDHTYAQLTNETNARAALNPKISADGSRVFYKLTDVAAPETASLVLFEIGAATSRVVAAGVSELSLAEGRIVSNDGRRLVYSALTAPNQTQIFLFDSRDNSIKQVTQLGSRVVDVKLQATISGDGRRIAFATRRRVLNASDGGVELYLLDLPTGQLQQITNAPAGATAEVISSLNFDGSLAAFNFPRLISDDVADADLRNNSEIYVASVPPRAVGAATVLNAAALGNESQPKRIAPGSMATIRGSKLALSTGVAADAPSLTLAGTTITVNGVQASMFYAAASEVIFVVPSDLSPGTAEFIVTNADGLSAKAEATISQAAPGVFTVNSDGRGAGIILDADSLMTGPFDPTSGQLRLSIFATGVVRAGSVAVTIKGRPVIVDTIAESGLPGLDEIHVLVPSDLRGAGTSTLQVAADEVLSNPVSVVMGGPAPAPSPTPTSSPTPTPTPAPSPTSTPTPGPSPTPTPSVSPTPTPTPTPTPGTASKILITQVFGGGGNAGAPFRNDFIEIFNAGSAPVNLAGWSVQYASATAATWSVTPLTSVVLLPGRYYLIQESSGGSNGVLLPTPDATGTIAMAAASGKVALVKNATALAGACPNDSNIVDLVGYGNTANCFRGSGPAAAASNTNAILRGGNGCTDTQNNSADFVVGPPNPRNTVQPAAQACMN